MKNSAKRPHDRRLANRDKNKKLAAGYTIVCIPCRKVTMDNIANPSPKAAKMRLKSANHNIG